MASPRRMSKLAPFSLSTLLYLVLISSIACRTATTTSNAAIPTATSTSPPVFVPARFERIHRPKNSDGQWSYPPDCHSRSQEFNDFNSFLYNHIDSELSEDIPHSLGKGDCTYYARWPFLEPSHFLEFIVLTKFSDQWIHMEFKNPHWKQESRVNIAIKLSGREVVSGARQVDDLIKDDVMLKVDGSQNIDYHGWRENGITTVRFGSKGDTTPSKGGSQFSDEHCALFLLPTKIGYNRKWYLKLNTTSIVSQHRIRFKSCPLFSEVLLWHETNPSSLSQAPNLYLQTLPPTASSPNLAVADSAPISTSTVGPNGAVVNAEQDLEAANNDNSSRPNDLGAKLGSPSSVVSTSASASGGLRDGSTGSAIGGSYSGPLNQSASLAAEPSLKCLAWMGFVAILLAVIAFRACFTFSKYKHKTRVYHIHASHFDGHHQQTCCQPNDDAIFKKILLPNEI